MNFGILGVIGLTKIFQTCSTSLRLKIDHHGEFQAQSKLAEVDRHEEPEATEHF